MKRNCEGYCGGKYDIGNMTQVGPDGERMCYDCAYKARNTYTDSDPNKDVTMSDPSTIFDFDSDPTFDTEKYSDVQRYEDFTDEEKAAHASLGEDFALAATLLAGEVPPVGTVIEKSCEGDNKAEALGRAYITRDQIRDAGGEAECEYIEPDIIIGNSLYHKVEITVTETASASEE